MSSTDEPQNESMLKLAKLPTAFYRICIEGNIGCGKTSILKYISSKYGFTDHSAEIWTPPQLPGGDNVNLVISPEPISRWTSVGPDGTNLLNQMYTNPCRYSFTFEHYSQITRHEQMKVVYEDHIARNTIVPGRKTMHLLERSIFSNRFVFVENFSKSGKMELVERQILHEWFELLMKHPECQINKFIYLQTTPETVFERIEKRARTEEETIPLDYLTEIHKYHEKLFNELEPECWQYLKQKTIHPKVVIIDANAPLEDVCRQVDKHIMSTIF